MLDGFKSGGKPGRIGGRVGRDRRAGSMSHSSGVCQVFQTYPGSLWMAGSWRSTDM